MAFLTVLHSHKCAICDKLCPCTLNDCAYRGTRAEGEWTCFLCNGMLADVADSFRLTIHRRETDV
jgi:hypothetical protein